MAVATKPIDTTTDAHQQIVSKADAEIQRIATAQHEIEIRLPLIQAEMADISLAAANRAQELENMRRSLISLQEAESKAKSYALLAQGTPAEATAVKAMKVATSDRKGHETILSKKETAATRAEQLDEKCLVELRAEMAEKTTRLAQLAQERRAVESAKAQAHAERGATLSAEIRARVESLAEEIAARRQALLDAQIELDSYLTDEALPRLNPWPEHVEQLRSITPNLEDATSRALNAALMYVDTLLAEAQALAPHIGRTDAVLYLRDWRSLLAVPDEEVWSGEQLNAIPAKLRARRERVALALRDYRRHMLNQGRG